MQMLRHFWNAATQLDPNVQFIEEAERCSICRPQLLQQLFEKAGLKTVEVTALEIDTVFQDFAEYWTPFLTDQGAAPRYCMSLDNTKRTALRNNLRNTLPMRADGSIHLTARAWAVRGQQP